MTTPSGQISLNDVNVELGFPGTTTISMNQSDVRTLAGVPSGAISMQNLQGKSNIFIYTISSNTTNLNLRSAAVSAGWNQTIPVQATINSGVYVYSNSTGSYALTIDGSWPAGVTLTNNGVIVGKGGTGSKSASLNDPGFKVNGGNAGPALLVQSAVTINNGSGRIAGGGGGGGSGSYNGELNVFTYTGGGGGGGIGNGDGWGGYKPGNPGSLTEAGTGGAGDSPSNSAPGGNGGGYGAAGSSGTGGYAYPGGSGGAAGAAVVGNSNITWNATGTRNGSIS